MRALHARDDRATGIIHDFPGYAAQHEAENFGTAMGSHHLQRRPNQPTCMTTLISIIKIIVMMYRPRPDSRIFITIDIPPARSLFFVREGVPVGASSDAALGGNPFTLKIDGTREKPLSLNLS
jgi:hypothetical protein